MKRIAYQKLLDWKTSPIRKPLIIRGARQVGKTWLMKEFGKHEYNDLAYFNFESSVHLHRIFQSGFDLQRILGALQIESGIAIEPSSTLLVFDEIQACPTALTMLKYFQENAPTYHIMSAGSLLGVAMHEEVSFPVGKVEFMDLHPLSFHEYLMAMGEEALLEGIERCDWELISLFCEKLTELLRQYYFVGGMPEAVYHFRDSHDYLLVREIQKRLLDAYEQDFSKHAPFEQVPRIRMVWKSVTSQLARENAKFVYSALRPGARAKEFELAIAWLQDAGLITKVTRISKPAIPLSAYEDINDFKIYLLDTGLLVAKGEISPEVLLRGNKLFTEFKGALTEQYVLQQLRSRDIRAYYWTVERSTAEVDFVIQAGNDVIPIEVKAEENLKSKSLRIYHDTFEPKRSFRTSLSSYREQDWMTNVPLYAFPTGVI